MAKFYNSDLADLTHQLTLSPRRLRVEQLLGVERLLMLIDPHRAYPFDFVCYHITKYRRRGASADASIPGKALISDLVTMAEVISRKANLLATELNEPFKSHEELANDLQVSTKTIRRWRSRGLMGLRAVRSMRASREIWQWRRPTLPGCPGRSHNDRAPCPRITSGNSLR